MKQQNNQQNNRQNDAEDTKDKQNPLSATIAWSSYAAPSAIAATSETGTESADQRGSESSLKSVGATTTG